MAWQSILTDQPISYARNNTAYRNASRENQWGEPVYFSPDNIPYTQTGYFGGPRYAYGYNYFDANNPNSSINGNCTWWCWARLLDTNGIRLTHNGGSMGDAKNWYDNYDGNKDLNANNANAGDIIVFTDNSAGHIMFIEQVDNDGTIHISHSAYSTRACWNGYSCRVGTYQKSEIYANASINMYKDCDPSNPYYVTVVGVIHTGSVSPTPTPTDDNIEILIDCVLKNKKHKMKITII